MARTIGIHGSATKVEPTLVMTFIELDRLGFRWTATKSPA